MQVCAFYLKLDAFVTHSKYIILYEQKFICVRNHVENCPRPDIHAELMASQIHWFVYEEQCSKKFASPKSFLKDANAQSNLNKIWATAKNEE